MKKFLKTVWGPEEGYVFIGFKNHLIKEGWSQESYKYPQQLDDLIKEVKSRNKTESVYFCPVLFHNTKKRSRENAKPSRVLWVDKDVGSLTELEPRPTYCWQTSEGKWQALWFLDKPLDGEMVELLNKKILSKVRGDKGTWDVGRYLRIPDTLNHKYKPAYQGITLWEDGPVNHKAKDFVDFPDLVDSVSLTDVEDVPEMPKKFPTFDEALIANGKRIPTVAWKLLEATPGPDDDWSDKIWHLESVLNKAGIPIEHVFAIAKGSPWNKYLRANRPDIDLWKDVYKNYTQKAIIPPDDDLEDLPWTTLDTLLYYSERPQWLVEDIWMAKNVGWIAGEGKSYKSVLSLDLALSIASGKPFLGKYEIKDPGPVLMVQEEDPIWRVAHRLQAMAQHKDIGESEVANNQERLILRMKDTGIPLFISVGGKLTFEDEPRMLALERAIDARRPRMVLLDPMFMMSAGMDEFKAGEMAQILNTLKQWRNDYGCAIAVIHHFRKSSGADTQKLYGSMALYAWSENSLLVQRESRESNLVSIRRDIKDAPSDDKLGVEFLDIDEEYKYILRDVRQSNISSNITSVMRDKPLEEFTIKNLQEFTGMSDRMVRENIKDLEIRGMVAVERKGRGGSIFIKPTSKLLDAPQEEIIFG